MVEITKEGVLDWYKGLNASLRVELVCALLDHSLPFELRFLGSVIEHFGRKDFHILRDAENKANSLHTSLNSTPAAVAAILQILSEGPAPANNSVNPQMMSNLGENHHHHHLHHTGGHSTGMGGEMGCAHIIQSIDKMERTVIHNILCYLLMLQLLQVSLWVGPVLRMTCEDQRQGTPSNHKRETIMSRQGFLE